MASTGPSGSCTVLRGAGASGTLGVAAARALTSGAADALPVADGWGFAGDLQAHAEEAKAKASINRAVHERLKPPGRTSSTP